MQAWRGWELRRPPGVVGLHYRQKRRLLGPYCAERCRSCGCRAGRLGNWRPWPALDIALPPPAPRGSAFALARSLTAGLDVAVPTSVLALCMLVLAGAYALIVGNTGVLRSTQLQLGMIYFGLIGGGAAPLRA